MPSRGGAVRLAGLVSVAVLLALVAFGAVMLATMLRWGYVGAGVVLLAAIPAGLYRLIGRGHLLHVLIVVPVAVLVPVLGLLAFDVLWAWAGLERPAPAVGIAVAGAVVAATAYSYLRWLGEPAVPHSEGWAAFACVAAVALAAITGQRIPWQLVATALCVAVATWVYLRWVAGPKIDHPLWWAMLPSSSR